MSEIARKAVNPLGNIATGTVELSVAEGNDPSLKGYDASVNVFFAGVAKLGKGAKLKILSNSGPEVRVLSPALRAYEVVDYPFDLLSQKLWFKSGYAHKGI